MNDKKKLALVVAALAAVIALSVLVYNGLKNKVDPETGELVGQSTAATAEPAADSAASAPAVQETAPAESAEAAPDFYMTDPEGNTVKLSDFKGTPVILNFWTSWCGYCQLEMPDFETAYGQYGDKIQFVMLNAATQEDSAQDGADYITQQGFTFPVYYDTEGDPLDLYAIRGFPTTVFIDADGNVADVNAGYIKEEALSEQIKGLLGE